MFHLRRAAVKALCSSAPTSIRVVPRTVPISHIARTSISSRITSTRYISSSIARRNAEESKPEAHQESSLLDEAASATSETGHQAAESASSAAKRAQEIASDTAEEANHNKDSLIDETQGAVQEGTRQAADVSSSAYERTKDFAADAYNSAAGAASSGLDAAGNLAKGDRSNVDRFPPNPKIYVGNLFFDVTQDQLAELMKPFGDIESSYIVKAKGGMSKGFGYVTFKSTGSATDAIGTLHEKVHAGRRLIVSYANPNYVAPTRPERAPRQPRSYSPVNPPTKTVFIGNMSYNMTDKDLNELFRQVKNVIDVRVAIDRRTGSPRGFAHADFLRVEDAQAAVEFLANREFYGRHLKVDYALESASKTRGDSATPRD